MSHDHNHDHEERELITLVDEQGNETLFEILFTIDGKEEFGKNYVLLVPVNAEEDEDGKITHKGDCPRVGNFAPSSRKTTQRRKYQAKNKQQVSLRDAVKMGGVGKLKRPFSTPSKQMPVNKKGKGDEEGDNLAMGFDAGIEALGEEENVEGSTPPPDPSSTSMPSLC